MTREELLALQHARRQANRDQFDRIVFAGLVDGKWASSTVPLAPDDADAALALLKTWVIQAPFGNPLSELRLAIARPHLRELVAALGAAPERFTASALELGANLPIGPVLQLPEWKRRKLALLADAMLIEPSQLSTWSAHEPVLATLFGILSLADETVLPERATALNAMSDWVSLTKPVCLPSNLLPALQHSAFSVSYLTAASKHRAKRAIVAQGKLMLGSCQESICTPRDATAHALKPKLTIVGELLLPTHAMYRCYAQSLQGLRERFDVTLLTDDTTACSQHSEFAGERVYFPSRQQDVAVLAQLVRNTNPDIIFYPSVGMCFWTFTLSMLRLAPLQLASVGHPAPVCSPTIDGTVMFDRLVAPPGDEYGTVYGFDMQGLPQVPRHIADAAHSPRSTARTVAVIAASNKLNPQFLGTVEKIMSKAPPGTKLKFFPNLQGTAHLQYELHLLKRFPSAAVAPSQDYSSYLKELQGCDLVLQSFPFGGTNTTMDALSAGVPMVCMDGLDIAAQVDPLLLREGGLAELCANGPDMYSDIALSLLWDEGFLARMTGLTFEATAKLSVAASRGSTSMADAIWRAWTDRESAHSAGST